MKTALISGTSSGLGQAFAQALLDLDWKVYGIARREAPLKLSQSSNYRHLVMDLEKPLNKQLLAAEFHEKHLNLLVNNAGVSRANPTIEWDRELFHTTFALHYTTPLELMAYFTELLVVGNGKIINIGSDSAFVAWDNWGTYCASKIALATHARAYALEHPEIHVTNLHPGAIDTPMIDSTEDDEMISSRDRFMAIKDITTVFVQLVSGLLEVPSGTDLLLFNNYETKEIGYIHEHEFMYNVDTETLTKLPDLKKYAV